MGLKHVWWACTCKQTYCKYCNDGVEPPELCSVCGAAYGELLKYCPGFRLNDDAIKFCYDGHVILLEAAKSFRAWGMPYPFPGKHGRTRLLPKERTTYSSIIFPNNLARIIKFKGTK